MNILKYLSSEELFIQLIKDLKDDFEDVPVIVQDYVFEDQRITIYKINFACAEYVFKVDTRNHNFPLMFPNNIFTVYFSLDEDQYDDYKLELIKELTKED